MVARRKRMDREEEAVKDRRITKFGRFKDSSFAILKEGLKKGVVF